ncbi:MAG: SRPBCC family protein [Candidatus Micrarchaeota archaeon]
MPKKIKTATIRQNVKFKAGPHEVYEALMDSEKHSEFTGSQARISREVGGKISAWGGSINGTNLELVKDRKVVQSWYCETDGWPQGHYSRLEITLKPVKGGTTLTMVNSGVPADATAAIAQGWKDYYWQPMKEMIEK